MAVRAEDLSLHDAIRRAAASPMAQAWDAKLEEARGSVKQARLSPNPRLYLQSEDLRPWADTFSFVDQTEDYGYLGQTFELDGKRAKRTGFAEAQLRQLASETALRRQQLATQVAAAYWRLAMQQHMVGLLEQDMRAVDDMVAYHRKRVDAGAMKGIDLERMQMERDRLTLALRAAQRDLGMNRAELLRLVGAQPEAVLHLTDPMDVIPKIAPLPLETALAARLDLQAAEAAVDAAQADLRLQRANAIPNLDLLGGYKRNSGIDTAYGAMQMDLPLRNRNQGEIERAKASINTANAMLAATRLRDAAEIRAAEEYYRQEQAVVEETLPDMRNRAKHNLDVASEAYRIGGLDLLRFLDAERAEYDVEVSALRTLADYQSAALQLQLAYGMQP